MSVYLQLSPSSAINTIIFSLFFSLLLAFIMRSNKLLGNIKYELLLLCLLFPIIKILIPVEIIPWSNNITVPYVLPTIINFLHKSFVIDSLGKFYIWDIVYRIILVISVINVIRLFVSYYTLIRENKNLCPVTDPMITGLVDKILQEQNKKSNITVKWSDVSTPPCILGITKPVILLSKDNWCEENLECVLRHELAHYIHGDLFFRYIWLFIKAFCWWNPAIYLLDRQLGKIIEIRADENALRKKDKEFQKQYMQTIVELSSNRLQRNIPFSASFQEKDGLAPRKRIEIMGYRINRKPLSFILTNILSTVLIIALTIAMCCFIFEPRSKSFLNQFMYSQPVSKENSFFIDNQDGTFDLYTDGLYGTTLDMRYLTNNVPIYQSLDEVPQQ